MNCRTALVITIALCLHATSAHADGLRAGVAAVDITNYDAGPVNDPLFAKALVISNGDTTACIITVVAVAVGEFGRRSKLRILAIPSSWRIR